MGTDPSEFVRRWPPRGQAVLGVRLLGLAIMVTTLPMAIYTIGTVITLVAGDELFADGVVGFLTKIMSSVWSMVEPGKTDGRLWWVYVALTVACVTSAWVVFSCGSRFYRFVGRVPR